MRAYILLGMAAILLVVQAGGADQRGSDAVSKLISLEEQWSRAYLQGDINILTTLLAEDFVITVEDGATYSKVGYIAHSGDSTLHVEISKLSDLKVRLHGNVAVVTGAYHEKGQSKGRAYEYRDRLTDVWINTGGRWQVIASHYSVPLHQ